MIHVSPFSCFLFLPFEVDWILSRNLRTLYASACPTRSQPDSASRYPSCDTLICNSSNSVLGLPDTSLHLQIPSLFICKSNVGMTTLTYGGTMFNNIGWIGVSKRSEKSSRSHTVCSAIGGSASSEKSSRSLTLCWTIGGSVSSEESSRSHTDCWANGDLVSSEKSFRSHLDCRAIGDSVSSEKSSRSHTDCWSTRAIMT